MLMVVLAPVLVTAMPPGSAVVITFPAMPPSPTETLVGEAGFESAEKCTYSCHPPAASAAINVPMNPRVR